MTFKELLDLCSWEDLEDFLYEFPDAGMGEGRWKMEGFHRMYDELCRMTPKGSKRKIRLRKPKDKGCDYPALFQCRLSVGLLLGRVPRAGDRPAQRDGTPAGSTRGGLHVCHVRTRVHRAGV